MHMKFLCQLLSLYKMRTRKKTDSINQTYKTLHFTINKTNQLSKQPNFPLSHHNRYWQRDNLESRSHLLFPRTRGAPIFMQIDQNFFHGRLRLHNQVLFQFWFNSSAGYCVQWHVFIVIVEFFLFLIVLVGNS